MDSTITERKQGWSSPIQRICGDHSDLGSNSKSAVSFYKTNDQNLLRRSVIKELGKINWDWSKHLVYWSCGYIKEAYHHHLEGMNQWKVWCESNSECSPRKGSLLAHRNQPLQPRGNGSCHHHLNSQVQAILAPWKASDLRAENSSLNSLFLSCCVLVRKVHVLIGKTADFMSLSPWSDHILTWECAGSFTGLVQYDNVTSPKIRPKCYGK